MGLDITAYSKLTPTPFKCQDMDAFEAEFAHVDGAYRDKDGTPVVLICPYPPFIEARSEPFMFDTVCRIDGDTFGFAAGSYSGYNRFRETISQHFFGVCAETVWNDFDHYKDMPVSRWVHFFDNEGIIGSELAKEIVPVLAANQRGYNEKWGNAPDGWWNVEKYDLWLKAFRLAADNGAVKFH